jgi:glycosyltransferase involved in cell wall biosynthesis
VRVLHVAEAFGGGLLEVVARIADAGVRDGGGAAIAYGRRPETPADPADVLAPGVELYDLDWRRSSLPSHVAAARQLRALAAGWRPDVVHLHSSYSGVVGVLALHGRAPLLYTPHSFASAAHGISTAKRLAYRAAERMAVRRTTAVGAVSPSEGDTARALGAARVTVIPNGIPELDGAALAAERPARSGRPRVMAAGRIVEQRRPLACARILAAISDVADVAWVGGGGAEDQPWGKEATTALAAAGAPPTGWCPRSEVLDQLRRSTVYLHWTNWDGQALSLLEAMACDTIIVASDIPPNREILDPRQVCATEADASALIRRILSDDALASALLAAQAERRREHSAERMVERWLALYQDLSGSPE